MDRYFSKCPKEKTSDIFSKLGRVVVVVGKSGIGKTWTVKKELDQYIEITADILRSKLGTIDFLEKIRSSNLPVILDEYESVSDLIGLREIKGAPSGGVFVITSHFVPKFDFDFVTYEFPIPTAEVLREIAPEASDEVIAESRGDIRVVLQSLNFTSDFRDDFNGPKEFVTSLVAKGSKKRPSDFIGYPISEPGNICSILNANYVDAEGIDHAETAEHFSLADMCEDRVYAGEWGLLPFFNFFGCILPCHEIGHNLTPPLKPGSTWTRYQNMCMRYKKVQTMARRRPGRQLSLDEILILRDYAENENVEILQEYHLIPQDMDVMNHLSPLRKIKPKVISNIKKCLTPKK